MTGPAGFSLEEALHLMAICAAVNANTTGVKPGPKPTPMPIPTPPDPGTFGWQLAHDPKRVVGDDNYWQLWRNTREPGAYALCFRGTTTNLSSVWEDLHLKPQPASVVVNGRAVPLAANPRAVVHSGFANALQQLLADDVLAVLNQFAANDTAGAGTRLRRLYLTGHSQGAAIATLCRSFLQYQDLSPGLKGLELKSYFFAQPKPGNVHFGYDFALITSVPGPGFSSAFRVTNDQDWIPEVPLTVELPSDLGAPNPFTVPKPANSSFLHRVLGWFAGAKWRLAYAPAGVPFVLHGNPGSNPDDPNDFLWQHHWQHYYLLVEQRLKST